MQVCTLLQTDNHVSTPPLSFLQAGCPSCRPTNSVKALKAKSNSLSACAINKQVHYWPMNQVTARNYKISKSRSRMLRPALRIGISPRGRDAYKPGEVFFVILKLWTDLLCNCFRQAAPSVAEAACDFASPAAAATKVRSTWHLITLTVSSGFHGYINRWTEN